ncbi:DNA polymerase III subunit gamma/tau [Rectinema subterraneum]|jgi:DNA polymerase-3 subunit gamma/tau|nr:DNA polymerase III subunit gamma/tau [Rectinema subterraneum]HBE46533.1 DNA polymerase III subunit gamma/tau [Spirochaetaceae bacterium]
MPFEVTATRKRPQNFEQLAGQNFVAATLISSLEQGRIAHAYLFSGPRGCGKTSTARILAKALNCEHGPTPHPCGTCASCLSISSGSSLDVIEIDGASNTSVDNIRQIKDEVLFAPNSGRYKIYIIDEVHMLSMSAFNALLKTIEEPPPYIVFIFATTEPHKVPATIKSRCQQFNFRLVPAETILELLRQAAAETGVETEEEALLWIAREAAGSVRDAYTLFDQIASFSGTKITAQNIRDTLGLVGLDRLNALFRAIVANDTKAAFTTLDEILIRGVSPEQFLSDAVDYCRSILLIHNDIQKEGLLCAPRSTFDADVLGVLTKERAEYAIAVLLDTYRHLKETIDPRFELELAIAKLSRISAYISQSELFDAIKAIKHTFLPQGSSQKGLPLPFQERASKNDSAEEAPLLRDLRSRQPESQSAQSARQTSRPSQPPETLAQKNNSQYSSPLDQEKPSVQLSASRSGTEVEPASSVSSSPSELRKRIIAKLRAENLFLASALEKSGEWIPKHNGFIIPVVNKVELDLISRFSALIASTGAQLMGAPCAIEAHLQKLQEVLHDEDSPKKSALMRDSETGNAHAQISSDEVPQHDQTPETNLLKEKSTLSSFQSAEDAFNGSDEGSLPQNNPAPPSSLDENDIRLIELVRKMFKGKVIETKPAFEPSAESRTSAHASVPIIEPPDIPEEPEEFPDTDTEEESYD